MAQKIIPHLWFNGVAKEAVDFYVSVFPNSSVKATTYYPEEGLLDFQKPLAGKELTIEFELNGDRFAAINAGPEFTFTEAVSFVIPCEDQAEIDYYWDKLSADPAAEQCGWCKDKYGMSWQITPTNIEELLQRPHAFEHMLAMKKLVIADF